MNFEETADLQYYYMLISVWEKYFVVSVVLETYCTGMRVDEMFVVERYYRIFHARVRLDTMGPAQTAHVCASALVVPVQAFHLYVSHSLELH